MQLDAVSAHQDPLPPRLVVAAVQFAPSTDPSTNLATLREHVRTAREQGARVVVAPEYSMYAVVRLDARVVGVAEPLTGPFVTGLGDIAREFGVVLVAGTVEQVASGNDRIHNTVVVLGTDGTLVTRYRKVHLYDAFGHLESDVVAPGAIEQPAVFAVEGVTFGIQTCFDLRFPEGIRRVAAAGAHALLLPAQWIPGPTKVDQWTTLVRARALENTVYVVAADQAAPWGAGSSMIVDPAGAVLSELGTDPAVTTAGIDLAHLDKVRAVNPSLALRRFAITEREPQ
ncbi:carbon-nitrogen hydrolase family protein [Nocardia sp. CNY236]|uniref:carbon-nitrogen hydrolase family protein n=1 Tax=Nocardia sp. CNY236 TaxID=1169152 RepID=UPI0004042DF7|nr:carbon-nitrogen hydrolase family protein [Nocardia sp. CNY236]